MFDRQQAGVDDREQPGVTPPDEEVVRLSGRIAEIHEFLARAYLARAGFERAGGYARPDPGSPSPEALYPPGNPLAPLGPPPRADGFAVGLCEAYRDRGRARLAREEYHLALADFGAALLFHPAASDRDLTGDLWDGRTEAWDNLCGSFPATEDSRDGARPEAIAPTWMARRVPVGHLVVGDNVLLAQYPPTPEGLRAAADLADRLADDPRARNALVERYLVDVDDFDVLVYAFDGARLRLDHLAPTPDDPDADDPGIDPEGD